MNWLLKDDNDDGENGGSGGGSSGGAGCGDSSYRYWALTKGL